CLLLTQSGHPSRTRRSIDRQSLCGYCRETRARARHRLGAGVRRREFMLLSAAAITWPAIVRAQQTTLPVVGFINGASAKPYAPNVNGFLQGLKETGYIEGQNVTVEYRWAEGQYDRLPEMAADLVRRRVNVIVANTPAAPAAKDATATIPIVFLT